MCSYSRSFICSINIVYYILFSIDLFIFVHSLYYVVRHLRHLFYICTTAFNFFIQFQSKSKQSWFSMPFSRICRDKFPVIVQELRDEDTKTMKRRKGKVCLVRVGKWILNNGWENFDKRNVNDLTHWLIRPSRRLMNKGHQFVRLELSSFITRRSNEMKNLDPEGM